MTGQIRLFALSCLLVIGWIHPTNAQRKSKDPVQQPELAKELSTMRDRDQKLRIKWAGMIKKGKTDSKKYKKTTTLLLETDRSNTARMKEIIAEFGWPTFDLVGERPSRNAWLLVQHADRDPLFQAECLPLLKAAVDKGQARPSNYAYLYDRVQVAFGEKQLYATQSSSNNGLWEGQFFPLEDESNVQVRRTEMGIEMSVEEYASSMGFSYTVPTKEEAEERADSITRRYEEYAGLARKAMSEKDYHQAVDHYMLAVECHGSVQTEDFVQLAKALSLAKHERVGKGYYILVKAAVRGWEGVNDFDDDPDFAYLKNEKSENWQDLMRLIDSLNHKTTK